MNWQPTDIIQSVALGILFVGFIVTWRKNGSAQKARDEKRAKAEATREANIASELVHINKAINSPDYGLQALSKEMGGMKTNCAKVTAGYDEKWKNLEKGRKRK